MTRRQASALMIAASAVPMAGMAHAAPAPDDFGAALLARLEGLAGERAVSFDLRDLSISTSFGQVDVSAVVKMLWGPGERQRLAMATAGAFEDVLNGLAATFAEEFDLQPEARLS